MNRLICQLSLVRDNFAIDLKLNLPGSGVSALFGPSGSGKTSLLRFLAGLEEHASGFIEVNNKRWFDSETFYSLKPHKRNVGYVFQDAALFPHLTVRKNIEYGYKRRSFQSAKLDLDEILDLTGVNPLLDRYPLKLSGGEKQRVAIARALARAPDLLLMDEPMASLDLQSKEQLFPYLEELILRLDIPVVYVSHSPDEVAKMADFIALLDKGKVKISGPMMNVMAHMNSPS